MSLPTLCTRARAAAELGVHPRHVWDYCQRWPVLRDGLRVVRVTPGSSGRMRVLGAAIEEHARVELLQGEEVTA